MTPHPPRLVIIDDDPKLAGLVSTIAREAYPEAKDLVIEVIITAEAAVLAIRRLHDAREAALVVISDFHLKPSVVTGIDVLGEVRRRLPRAKRVLMTGADPEELESVLEHAQLDAFVSKPFTFDEMQALIRRLVGEVVHESRERPVLVATSSLAAPRKE